MVDDEGNGVKMDQGREHHHVGGKRRAVVAFGPMRLGHRFDSCERCGPNGSRADHTRYSSGNRKIHTISTKCQ